MRVLLIHQAFVAGDEAGGTRHWELARLLARKGDTMAVITGSTSYLTGGHMASRPRPARWETREGVPIARVFAPPGLHRSFVRRVLSFASFALAAMWAGFQTEDVDVSLGTTPPFVQPFASWIVARSRRVPFVLEIRDLWLDAARELGIVRDPRLIWLARHAERFLYARADHIIVNSPAYVGYVRGMGVNANRISVVPNGTTITMFDPAACGVDARGRYGLHDKFLVVYAGALGVPNGLESVLDAAEILSQTQSGVQFLLVGDGKRRASLMQSASARDLTNVTFIPAVAKDEIPEILAAADVCLASLRDTPVLKTTYPNKVFDYMAAGRPIILAIDGAIREVVETANAGLFVRPGDAMGMADAIRRLHADPILRREMGASGRLYVTAHFDRERQADEFRQLLHRVVSRKNR